MKMKLSFRWYGDEDNVPLSHIAQIPGMKHIVSAVYDTAVGEVWSRDSLRRLSDTCRNAGLAFSVAESIPVHENIKLGRGDIHKLLDNYCENIKRVSEVGIDCVTYNFMPIFDWTRTQLDHELDDGSKSLVMYKEQLRGLNPLVDDVSLPGWNVSYTKDEIRGLIGAYADLGEEGLWRNLEVFLKAVIPVAEEHGVKMAIHPDDPPYSVFGIPRIITNEQSLDRVLSVYNSPSNCLCMCTGSLGCAESNDLPKMIKKYAEAKKIAFMHIRNVKNLPDGSFEEVAHLSECGSVDMLEVVKALVQADYDGYVRPDHGRMIWGECGKAGYGLYDRALGAAYINGLFEACEKFYLNG